MGLTVGGARKLGCRIQLNPMILVGVSENLWKISNGKQDSVHQQYEHELHFCQINCVVLLLGM